eukprot:c14920_g1_i2.p1 GENE.c14920_g1_i2~~c14920_g1_i2.p1  ORF type:complete len:300 (+),score=103.10 c14920_g1_i2:25-924(+)
MEYFMQGLCLTYGLGNEKGVNEKQAYEMFEKALESGYSPSAVLMARLLKNGDGVVKDDYKARKLCYIALQMKVEDLAQKGDSNAQFAVGFLCYHGIGVPKDVDKALQYFLKSANQNNSVAQYSLGYIYQKGQGVIQSTDEAIKWYKKSATQRNSNAECNLGGIYCSDIAHQDYKLSLEWLLKSTEQGDSVSQLQLGLMYKYGRGVEQDLNESIKWFTKSAENNNSVSQLNLGIIYKYDKSPPNHAESMKWMKRSSQENNISAQFHLGFIYFQGEQGIERDHREALKYFYACLIFEDSEK